MTDNLGIGTGYFVLEEQGRIVAGAQAHQAHWSIEKLPGFVVLLLPVIPHLPLVSRIFNPRAFRFLTFEGFFAEPGYEGRLQDLLEAILARYGYHSAIFWFDERDSFCPQLLKHNRMGLLHQFVGGFEARFMGFRKRRPPG
ncbi:MAG: hypothetical protein J5I98_33820 [Phaeodactylibacter sp.]|nr:hypothetical protein [Phaeodactylibacter sp.]